MNIYVIAVMVSVMYSMSIGAISSEPVYQETVNIINATEKIQPKKKVVLPVKEKTKRAYVSVWVDGHTYSFEDKSEEGWEPRELPIFNHATGKNTGYVALYTRDKGLGIYPINNDILVAGLLRVPGVYKNNIFIPKFVGLFEDIRDNKALKKIAAQYMDKNAVGNIWFGGDTGGFRELLDRKS